MYRWNRSRFGDTRWANWEMPQLWRRLQFHHWKGIHIDSIHLDTSTGESRILVSEFWCHQVGPPAPMVRISMISTKVRVTRCHSNWPNPLFPQHSSTMLSQKLDGQEPKTLEVEDAGASASVGSWLLCGCWKFGYTQPGGRKSDCMEPSWVLTMEWERKTRWLVEILYKTAESFPLQSSKRNREKTDSVYSVVASFPIFPELSLRHSHIYIYNIHTPLYTILSTY